MTPTDYGSFACSRHFRKHGRSRKVQTFLPHSQLDVIDNNDHLGCGFIHLAFLVKLRGNSQTTHGVFEIQVKKIELSSVGISKSLLFVREDMEEYKIQLPTSMAKVDKSITIPLRAHAVLVICQCFPSSNQEYELLTP